jgi:DNA-directed RNA polymerase subunit RPC12/RpoP
MTYECHECEKEFQTNANLLQHLRDAGHIQCSDCTDLFSSTAALSAHRNDMH